MKPERAIAACLSALAAGLVALLLFGPTEGAEAKQESQEATTTAPEPQTTTEIETEPVTTTEAEPITTTEPEPDPLPFLPGDGTFPEPVTITLFFRSEVDWRRQKLPTKVPELRIEARARSIRGEAGDVHGIECTLDRRATYTFLVDPWSNTYVLSRTNPVSLVAIDLDSGEADSLRKPPQSNFLSLTCESRRAGTMLSLRANGELVAALLDRGNSGRFSAISLTAWSPEGGQEVVFDGVVVETGRS